MPSRREIQWSQLKVGILVLAAIAILIGLIFLMNGSTGGMFARKIILRAYFPNAAGIKEGAPVTLEGVTIGNVLKLRVVPDRNPNAVRTAIRSPRNRVRNPRAHPRLLVPEMDEGGGEWAKQLNHRFEQIDVDDLPLSGTCSMHEGRSG